MSAIIEEKPKKATRRDWNFRGAWDMDHVWSDPRMEGLGPAGKALAVYCMGGEQTRILGIQKFSIRMAAEDLECTCKQARRLFRRVLQAFGWRYDRVKRVLWMHDHLERRLRPTQSMVRQALRQVYNLPKSPLVAEFLAAGAPPDLGLDEVWSTTLARLKRIRPKDWPSLEEVEPSAESTPVETSPAAQATSETSETLLEKAIEPPEKAAETAKAPGVEPQAMPPESSLAESHSPVEPPVKLSAVEVPIVGTSSKVRSIKLTGAARKGERRAALKAARQAKSAARSASPSACPSPPNPPTVKVPEVRVPEVRPPRIRGRKPTLSDVREFLTIMVGPQLADEFLQPRDPVLMQQLFG